VTTKLCKFSKWKQLKELLIKPGVVNGKIETLRDGETSVFLCETESFSLFKLRDREIWDFWTLRKKSRLRDLKSAEKTRLLYPWNSDKILRDPDFLKDHSPPLKPLTILPSFYRYRWSATIKTSIRKLTKCSMKLFFGLSFEGCTSMIAVVTLQILPSCLKKLVSFLAV